MRRLGIVAALALMAGTAAAAEFRSGDRPVASAPVEDDLFIAGRTVAVDAPIGGRLFAGGGSVAVVGPVADDAMLAGGRVTVDGSVAGDLLAVGGSVEVAGQVAGDAAVAGASVTLSRGGVVAGDLAVTAGEVSIDGTVAGDVQVAAGDVTVRGTINGDLDVASGELTLLPGAVIMGSINHTGPDHADLPAGVTVGGDVVTERKEPRLTDRMVPTLVGTVGSAIGLFLLGAVLFLLFPRFVSGAAFAVNAAPWRTFWVGLGTVVLTPLLMIALCVTIIGIPIALAALFVYLVALMLGLAMAGFGLAELARRRAERAGGPRDVLKRYAFIALVITLVGMVPVLGDVALFAALALGVGAFITQMLSGRRPAGA